MTPGADIVIDGTLFAGQLADGELIELRIAERALCADSIGLFGSTVVNVAEFTTNVSSVLCGKSKETLLPLDVKLIGRELADGTPTELKLADGILNVFTPTPTTGPLTGATVGTVTAT